MANRALGNAAGGGGIIAVLLAGVLVAEGGYVNDPNDPGGATRWGCTEAVARADGYEGPMGQLPRERCVSIMRRQYIERPGFMPIVEREPVLAYEIIDSGINAGPGRSALWFQQALNDFNRGGRDYSSIAVDGDVGPATIRAYDALRRKRGKVKSCELLVKAADAYQAAHYQRLCRNSTRLATFCVGWFDHRIWNAPVEKCGTGTL